MKREDNKWMNASGIVTISSLTTLILNRFQHKKATLAHTNSRQLRERGSEARGVKKVQLVYINGWAVPDVQLKKGSDTYRPLSAVLRYSPTTPPNSQTTCLSRSVLCYINTLQRTKKKCF